MFLHKQSLTSSFRLTAITLAATLVTAGCSSNPEPIQSAAPPMPSPEATERGTPFWPQLVAAPAPAMRGSWPVPVLVLVVPILLGACDVDTER